MAHEGPHDRNEQRRLEEVKRLGHKSDYTGPVKQWVRRHAWLPLGQARLEMVKAQGAAEYLTYFHNTHLLYVNYKCCFEEKQQNRSASSL